MNEQISCPSERVWQGLSTRAAVLSGVLALATVMLDIPATPSAFAQAKDVVDEWASVKAPPATELKAVTIDPKGTALLMLDFVKQICNAERTPRCTASIPKIQNLLTQESR
jgi:hypothetical protein